MDNQYINLLDEFNNEERTIFLYCFVLKLSSREAARRLKISRNRASEICKIINQQKDLLFIKSLINKLHNGVPLDVL